MLAPATAHHAARAALISLMALLTACGARSALRMGEQTSGGEGGSGAAGGSGGAGGDGGAGGVGGAGGAQTVCTVVEPIASLGGGEGWHQRRPDLAFTSEDFQRVTVVSAWSVADVPGTPPVELRHTSLYPWAAWPPDGAIAPSFLADLDGGASFAAASSSQGLLALAFTRPGEPVRFAWDFVPESGVVPFSQQIGGDPPQRALFNVAGAAGHEHLVGAEIPRPFSPGYEAAFWADFEGAFQGAAFVGCSADPIAADAMRFDEDWLVAVAEGGPNTAASCAPDVVPGPPTFIQLFRMDEIGINALGERIDVGLPVTSVQLARHPDGDAWLVYGVEANGVRSALYGRVSEAGFVVDGSHLLHEGPAPSPLVADAMGDRLVVAWRDAESRIRVELVDRDGARFTSEILTNGQVIGAPSVLGWPDGRGLLVAWSETPAGGGGDRVRVARLDCGAEE